MKPVPPRDASIEREFGPHLRAALDEYIALERRVRPVASGTCAGTCGACRNPCCHAFFCEEAWETPWLRAATSRRGAVRAVAPEDAIEGHLARDGCRLRFGRPPVCYEFACADVLGTFPTDEQKYLFRVVSHVITFAGEDALPGTHLVEVQELGKLDRARVARLRARIALAGKIFDAAARLLDRGGRGGADDPPRTTLRAGENGRPRDAADWALVTAHFSTKGYRFSRLEGARANGAGGRPMRTLPIVRAILAVATLALGAALAGCGGPPKRLELTQPKPVSAGVFRDEDVEVTFDATAEAIKVWIRNRTKETLTVPFYKARFIDPSGTQREVVGYQGTPSMSLVKEVQAPVEIEPGATWSGLVHPKDRLRPVSGSEARALSLLASDEAAEGKVVGLDLETEFGARPHRYEFKLTVRPPAPAGQGAN